MNKIKVNTSFCQKVGHLQSYSIENLKVLQNLPTPVKVRAKHKKVQKNFQGNSLYQATKQHLKLNNYCFYFTSNFCLLWVALGNLQLIH